MYVHHSNINVCGVYKRVSTDIVNDNGCVGVACVAARLYYKILLLPYHLHISHKERIILHPKYSRSSSE